MAASFADTIKNLQKLCDATNTEQNEQSGSGKVDLTNIFASKLNQPMPATDALRDFLEALPKNELFAVLAVMYKGRDRPRALKCDPAQHLKTNLTGYRERDEAVAAIMRVGDRMTHADCALGQMTADSIDQLPTRVEQVLKKR